MLAVLPVHAIYAGFVLRESLVVLTSILAVWTLTEVWHAEPQSGRAWTWAAVAGLCGGLAILARTTALALLAAAGLFFLVARGRRQFGPFLLWGACITLVILPWALATFWEYGSPFYSYTSYFEYNFSWTVHHYEKGNTLPSQFYTAANLPEIVRVKIKSLLIIVVYSTMIVGLPIVAGFLGRLRSRGSPGRDVDLLIATIFVVFVLATLKSVADVTQVAQLGRYYLPVFVLAVADGGRRPDRLVRGASDPSNGHPLARGRLLRPGLGRPDLGLRRVLAGQAVPAPLAGAPRGGRLDPAAPRTRSRATPGS